MRPGRDPNVPHPGMVFYGGRWASPAAVEAQRRRARKYHHDGRAKPRSRATGGSPHRWTSETARAASRLAHSSFCRDAPPERAPSEVRAAYGRAHPNSVLRRRYPTWAELDRAWRRGELSV